MLHVPVGGIAGAVAIGYLLAVVLLVCCVRRSNGAAAWVLGAAAVVSALVVSVWPVVAVAMSGVAQAQDVVPFIHGLITRVLHR
ncbi:hypothetical protein [Amnibacterium kyonggiense]